MRTIGRQTGIQRTKQRPARRRRLVLLISIVAIVGRIARSAFAAAGMVPVAFHIWLTFGLTGHSPDMKAWVTFSAFVGAFVSSVLAARAGRLVLPGNGAFPC